MLLQGNIRSEKEANDVRCFLDLLVGGAEQNEDDGDAEGGAAMGA